MGKMAIGLSFQLPFKYQFQLQYRITAFSHPSLSLVGGFISWLLSVPILLPGKQNRSKISVRCLAQGRNIVVILARRSPLHIRSGSTLLTISK